MGSYDRMPEDYDGPAPEHVIKCTSGWSGAFGLRHEHKTVDLVRACYLAAKDQKDGIEVWPCSWLLEGRYDDGSKFHFECGLPTRYDDTAQDGSYECDGGHSHVPAQARFEQGWDYTEDLAEAEGMMRHGVRPVQMNGQAWF